MTVKLAKKAFYFQGSDKNIADVGGATITSIIFVF